MTEPDWKLGRNGFGQLELTGSDGSVQAGVVPVRAFPIAAPLEGIALVSQEGHELVWLEHLDQAGPVRRALIEQELAQREFVPEIRRLLAVSSFATPSTWTVATDRGETRLVLRGEEDIRRLGSRMLMIADLHGIQYLVRDLKALDRHSRKLLDRFL